MNARTKIVATLGPATDRPHVLDEMLIAGVDVVRLNLSHGHARRATSTGCMRCARPRERTGSVVAVLADLPGPKVRAAPFPGSGVDLAAGSTVTLVTDVEHSSSRASIGVDYETLLARPARPATGS